jgi:myo-inositol-1(or 4)-monophosphatase
LRVAVASELRAAAEHAARRGGEIVRSRFHETRTVDFKGRIDLVTDADRAAEEAILTYVRREFPRDDIVAEESQTSPGNAEHRWYIDPLDGTTNYAHGVPHFCVSVGIVDAAGPVAGAVYHPLLDEMYSASRGGGATLNGEGIGVSTRAPVSQSLLATGFPYDVWTRPEPPVRLFTLALGRARGVRRFGAAALDLAYVACGRFDGYFELGLFPWDVAAGALLVREAGGVVSDLVGGPLDLAGRQILASNGLLHRELTSLFDSAG